MLFDPKIKHNGKIRNIQLVDPSKIVLKDYNSIRNSFKQNDTLLINENDTITSAIAKLEESLHPSREFYIDTDAMKKLYPDKYFYEIDDYGSVVLQNLFDGMKIIFNRPIDDLRGFEHNYSSKMTMGQFVFNIACSYDTITENVDNPIWTPVICDIRQLTMKTIVYQNFIPTDVGNFDISEFQYYYLILDKYVAHTNYITIYKTNIERMNLFLSSGRNIY